MKIRTILLLHAHLPYINHINADYIEENWYFENVVESYIPILKMIEELASEDIPARFTISISPTLSAMMENENLEKKLERYINLRMKLIERELTIAGDKRITSLLEFYSRAYSDALEFINRYSGDLITPFKIYQNQGIIEIITTPATYPIIPLIVDNETLDAQITIASSDYKDRFIKNLNGIFLSECAYDKRVENYLLKNSIKYFFVSEEAIDISRNSPFEAYKTPDYLNFFVCNLKLMKKITGENSYLSNPLYREFYKDIGYERDPEYLKDYTLSTQRIPTGLKYYRITDIKKPLAEKDIYEVEIALKQAEKDSVDFLNNIVESSSGSGNDPILTMAFNMELFGHRWFEGIEFLKSFIRNIRTLRYPIQLITPSECITNGYVLNSKTLAPSLSCLSEDGSFVKWINGKNDFLYPYIYEITKKYTRLINKFINSHIPFELDRALKQLTREILLMQSSDWAIMINNDTHKDYAINRFKRHYENAIKIIKDLEEGNVDIGFIKTLEVENNIFHLINWRNFATKSSF